MKNSLATGLISIWILTAPAAAAGAKSEMELRRKDSVWFAANPRSLPRWETLEERKAGKAYFADLDEEYRGRAHATPPPGPLRNPGEFERASAVVIRYPFGVSIALVKELALTTPTICLVTAAEQAQARREMERGGVDLTGVRFILATTDSYWTRDYTPWPIFDAQGKPGLVKFTYNRPRPGDDAAGAAIAKALDLPLYPLNLLHAGGNYMTDGFGISASTELVYEENSGLGRAEVTRRMENALGIKTYHAVDDPTGEAIKHIDTWSKFLAPDKVMVRRVPRSHRQYAAIERAAAFFTAQISAYGRPYRVFRVDTPFDEPYCNALILNDKVLVAITGGSNDLAALESYRRALPGYRVLGFAGEWLSTDALHCRTFGMVDPGLLHISHLALGDTVAPGSGGFSIEAAITAHSGKGLVADSLSLFYQLPSQTGFTRMTMAPGGPSQFRALIPEPTASGKVLYFLRAVDSSGRKENHPFIGEADAHAFFARVSAVAIASPGKRPGALALRVPEGIGGSVFYNVSGREIPPPRARGPAVFFPHP